MSRNATFFSFNPNVLSHVWSVYIYCVWVYETKLPAFTFCFVCPDYNVKAYGSLRQLNGNISRLDLIDLSRCIYIYILVFRSIRFPQFIQINQIQLQFSVDSWKLFQFYRIYRWEIFSWFGIVPSGCSNLVCHLFHKQSLTRSYLLLLLPAFILTFLWKTHVHWLHR